LYFIFENKNLRYNIEIIAERHRFAFLPLLIPRRIAITTSESFRLHSGSSMSTVVEGGDIGWKTEAVVKREPDTEMNGWKKLTEQNFTLFGWVTTLNDRFQHWLWSPRQKGRALHQRLFRAVFRILYIMVTEAKRERLSLRASSLTFTIVLSLVPMLALGTAVLKGLGAGDQMKNAAYRIIDNLDQSSSFLPSTNPAGQTVGKSTASQETAGPQANRTLTSHLKKATDTIFAYVDRTNFATLGAFGIIGLVLAVLSLLGNIEATMNAIWHAHSNRPFGRKMIDYLSLMILLPVSVNLTLAAETVLQSPTLFDRVQRFIPLFWLQSLLLTMMPLLIVVSAFTLLYRFLPHTKVKFLPALLGGVAGGIGWLTLQSVYIRLQIGVARYNTIYGSFATLPLFLVWLYMGWLVFLIGAEVAFAVQVWRRYLPAGDRLTPLDRLTIAFEIVATIQEAFHHRRVVNTKTLASVLNRSEGHIQEILEDLEKAGVVHHVQEKNQEGFMPAGPDEMIQARDIVRMVFGTATCDEQHHPLTLKTLEAAMAALSDKKIELPDRLRKEVQSMPAGMIQSSLFTSKTEDQQTTTSCNGQL